MKKNASILMATLTLTAIILGVVLLTLPARNASAEMINVQPGLTMITAGVGIGGQEYLIIMDKATNKVVVYNLNVQNMELIAAGDYTKMFTLAGGAGGGPGGAGGGAPPRY